MPAKRATKSKATRPTRRTKVAVADAPTPPPPTPQSASEPVWLVRTVVVLFLIGFATFLARELRNALDALP